MLHNAMTKILLSGVFAICLVCSAFAQGAPDVRFIQPEGLARAGAYTHVVSVSGGRAIYISGQVALDKTGALVGKGDMRAQAEQVFQNLKLALEAAGATFKDVVKMTYYVVDMSQFQAVRDVRAKYLSAENPPASTAVGVTRLVSPDMLLEIEAIAIVPK